MELDIWYISAYDAPEGQSSRTYDYAKELTELGHKVTFITSSYNHFTYEEKLDKGEKFREEWYEKIRVIWLKTFPYKGNGWQRGLNMLTNAWKAYWVGKKLQEKPDVIFGPSVPLFTGLSAYFLAKKKEAIFCFEIRDIWPQALIDLGVLKEQGIITKLFRKIEIFLYKKSDMIVSALPFAYKHICKYNIAREKIIWMPNGVNLERFKNQKPYTRQKQNQLVVMYIGRAAIGHGIEVILKSVKILQDRGNSSIKIIFVGGGPKKQHFQELAVDLQLKNIDFRNSVPKDIIPKVIEEADVLIASSRNLSIHQFGTNSNKIYDYLASARPIIFANNAPNNPVKEAEAGISIPSDDLDAMVASFEHFLLMSPQECHRLGKNGRKYAEEHFDIKILARKLEIELIELIELIKQK